jgi:hypothetical protein
MIASSFIICTMATVYVLTTTPVGGVGRFLAPDSMAMITLLTIFGLRPLVTDRFSERTLYGYIPDGHGEQQALLVGIIAACALSVGALVGNQSPGARRAALPPHAPRPRWVFTMQVRHLLYASLLGGSTYVAIFAATAGVSSLRALSSGRSENVTLGGVPEVVLVLPITGSIAAALFLISKRGVPIKRKDLLAIALAVATSVVLLSQLGNRRFLIPAILIPAIAALMRRPTPLRLWHAMSFGTALVFLAIVPMVRSAGARLPGENILTAAVRYLEQEGLLAVLRPVLAGYDTEMLDYVALHAPRVEAGILGLGRGTILEFALRPLPSSIAPLRPYSDQVMDRYWGGGCGDPVCPVASLPGVLYFDGGLLLVAVGCLVTGVVLRRMAIGWRASDKLSSLRCTYLSIGTAFVLVATRTNTVHAIWWALYCCLIAACIYWPLTSRPPDVSPGSHRGTEHRIDTNGGAGS